MRVWPRRPRFTSCPKSLLLLFALLALTATSCVNVAKSTKNAPVLLKAYDRLPAQVLVDKVNSLQAINTMTANASLRLTDLKLNEKGKIEPYRPADALLVLQRPEQIRLRVRIPFIKQNVADMTSDGERFRIAVFYPDEYRRFLVGSNQRGYEEKLESLISKNPKQREVGSISRIRPQHITEALLIKPVEKNDTLSFFISDLVREEEEVRAGQKPRKVMRSYQLLYVLERGEGGELRLQRQFWFDRTQPSLPLARMQVYGNDGALQAEIDYRQYQSFEGVTFPKVVDIVRARDNYAIELTFDDIKKKNPEEVAKGAFLLENTEKLPEQDLDAPQQQPRTSPEH